MTNTYFQKGNTARTYTVETDATVARTSVSYRHRKTRPPPPKDARASPTSIPDFTQRARTCTGVRVKHRSSETLQLLSEPPRPGSTRPIRSVTCAGQSLPVGRARGPPTSPPRPPSPSRTSTRADVDAQDRPEPPSRSRCLGLAGPGCGDVIAPGWRPPSRSSREGSRAGTHPVCPSKV